MQIMAVAREHLVTVFDMSGGVLTILVGEVLEL